MDWTKISENWDVFVNGLKEFFNQPVPIIGCSVAALLVCVLTILSKTSFGKKLLFRLKTMILDIKFEMEAWIKLADQELKDIKQYTESEVLKTGALVGECVKLLEIVCENSHNAKIKEAYTEFKANTEQVKLDFENYVAEKIEETHLDEINQLKDQIKLLSEAVFHEETKED